MWSDNQITFAGESVILNNTYRFCLANGSGLTRLNTVTAQREIYAAEVLPINGYSRKLIGFTAGAYNTGNQRYEFPMALVSMAATGTIAYNHIFWIRNGRGLNSLVTVNAGTGELTFSGSHNLSENDRIMMAGSGTAPSGISLNIFYYANIVSPTVIRLKATSGGSVISSFGSTGTGTLYIRDCTGEIAALLPKSASVIYDGQIKEFPIYLTFANTGAIVGI
ncbi:MAG: hypothetical protein LRZ84_14490 [Desertifilum sp.]|nr:hypothetical protein [Desertifilum sp.]